MASENAKNGIKEDLNFRPNCVPVFRARRAEFLRCAYQSGGAEAGVRDGIAAWPPAPVDHRITQDDVASVEGGDRDHRR